MYPLQDNIDNSVHESNFTGFINETTATTTTHAESISNRSDISVMNNDYFPAAHTTNSLDYNNCNQPIPQSTSKNNIISPGHNYQQPTFNDFSNNNFNISPNNKYHQQSCLHIRNSTRNTLIKIRLKPTMFFLHLIHLVLL
ncbi:unnamed protein product [Rhizophagus irregularis]|nr:unnamed protein product [Rhizophagus irregularis]